MSVPRVAALSQEDPVWVIAPAGPIPEPRLRKSVAQLRHRGVKVHLPDQVLLKDGYFAGEDALRLRSLCAALTAKEHRTVWAARGGYGVTRLLHRLPQTLPCPPRVIGFSDISALLCALYCRFGVASIHGPVLVQWAELGPEDQARTWSMLCGEIPAPLEAQAGPAVLGGQVEGPLIASNLELFRSLIGTPYLPDVRGCILALEDVGERPYRLDRSLTQLLSSGAFAGVKGIALGQFHACDPPHPDEPTAQEVVIERLSTLQVPILGGLPFGHTPGHNAALPFGTKVRLHVDHGMLEMLTPVFSS